MSFSCHFQILPTISEVQLTLLTVLTVLRVKSAVPLKWQVGFENGMKMIPIFTIIFISKMHYITGTYFFSQWPELSIRDIVRYVLKLWQSAFLLYCRRLAIGLDLVFCELHITCFVLSEKKSFLCNWWAHKDKLKL